jgi:uncharacterized protein YegP (UPF0339 family)
METKVYRRKDGKWAWKLIAENGQIIATDGGQGYEHRQDAFEMASTIIEGGYRDAAILIEGVDYDTEPVGVESPSE